jgi:hypothetical protein
MRDPSAVAQEPLLAAIGLIFQQRPPSRMRRAEIKRNCVKQQVAARHYPWSKAGNNILFSQINVRLRPDYLRCDTRCGNALCKIKAASCA